MKATNKQYDLNVENVEELMENLEEVTIRITIWNTISLAIYIGIKLANLTYCMYIQTFADQQEIDKVLASGSSSDLDDDELLQELEQLVNDSAADSASKKTVQTISSSPSPSQQPIANEKEQPGHSLSDIEATLAQLEINETTATKVHDGHQEEVLLS